jgi:hypothetical protein
MLSVNPTTGRELDGAAVCDQAEARAILPAVRDYEAAA